MVYCTIHAYLNGNPNKIYRPIGSNQTICGQDAAANYPYIYFYNPLEGLDSRYCMKECPYFKDGNLVLTECYTNNYGPGCSAYNVIMLQNGSFAAGSAPNPYNNLYIGYETTPVLNRVCLPSSSVLTNGLADYAANLTSSLQQGSFASLTTDIQNVSYYLTLELAMASRSSRICSCCFSFVYVSFEMFGRMHCLVIYSRSNIRFCRNRSPLLL